MISIVTLLATASHMLPILTHCVLCICLQCFDTVGWAVGRASGP